MEELAQSHRGGLSFYDSCLMPISCIRRGPEDQATTKGHTVCTYLSSVGDLLTARVFSVGKAPEAHFVPTCRQHREKHTGPWLRVKWPYLSKQVNSISGVRVSELPGLLFCLGLWLCSPPDWKRFLRSPWWLLTRGWEALVEEFSF